VCLAGIQKELGETMSYRKDTQIESQRAKKHVQCRESGKERGAPQERDAGIKKDIENLAGSAAIATPVNTTIKSILPGKKKIEPVPGRGDGVYHFYKSQTEDSADTKGSQWRKGEKER